MQKNYRPGGVGMVAAAQGTYLVQAFFDGGQAEVVRANVIAWQICADRSLIPMVVDPRAAEVDPWCVLHPDGRVESSSGAVWRSEAGWLDDLRRLGRDAA